MKNEIICISNLTEIVLYLFPNMMRLELCAIAALQQMANSFLP